MELNHTFVICAYKESPYLEECIQSILQQKVSSQVLISTSTPNDYIRAAAKKYGIALYVNDRDAGITQDWNFGYAQAKTEYVTIAHQDDVYLDTYTSSVMEAAEKHPDMLIAFTDYGELRNGEKTDSNTNLKIKRILLSPMRTGILKNRRLFKRAVLSLGNPICCPSVTFHRTKLPPTVFTAGFRSNEDWEAWERISRYPGSFCYIPEIQMYHRIHEGSETSSIINDNSRTGEDYAMFRKFWPPLCARMLSKVYSLSEKSNSLD